MRRVYLNHFYLAYFMDILLFWYKFELKIRWFVGITLIFIDEKTVANCNCKVIKFNSSYYAEFSSHILDLHTYSWKPLLIQVTFVLDEFGSWSVDFWLKQQQKFENP